MTALTDRSPWQNGLEADPMPEHLMAPHEIALRALTQAAQTTRESIDRLDTLLDGAGQ